MARVEASISLALQSLHRLRRGSWLVMGSGGWIAIPVGLPDALPDTTLGSANGGKSPGVSLPLPSPSPVTPWTNRAHNPTPGAAGRLSESGPASSGPRLPFFGEEVAMSFPATAAAGAAGFAITSPAFGGLSRTAGWRYRCGW